MESSGDDFRDESRPVDAKAGEEDVERWWMEVEVEVWQLLMPGGVGYLMEEPKVMVEVVVVEVEVEEGWLRFSYVVLKTTETVVSRKEVKNWMI